MTVIILFTLTVVLRNKNIAFKDLAVSSTETPFATRILSSADWVSSAVTINEVVEESDLIVRVQVLSQPKSRIVRSEVPVWTADNEIAGSTIIETLFSDTVFKVLKTYYGKPQTNITVMQTGGYDPAIANSIVEIVDDPLYDLGEEYILFLVDISGDSVQAPDRELYRIVNPFGRYAIEGEVVSSFGENLGSGAVPDIATLTELEIEIEKSLSAKFAVPTEPATAPTELLEQTPTVMP